MRALYDQTNGDPMHWIDISSIGPVIGVDDSQELPVLTVVELRQVEELLTKLRQASDRGELELEGEA